MHRKIAMRSFSYFSKYLVMPEAWSRSWMHTGNPSRLQTGGRAALSRPNQKIKTLKTLKKKLE
jgi:hypothetical protein